jgi:predicted alpha-1,2-mannosidase
MGMIFQRCFSLLSKVWGFSFLITFSLAAQQADTNSNYFDLVNPLIGTLNKGNLSNGNLHPVISYPWGMNHWTPQTGSANDRWIYNYNADKITGFKQTHQASVWLGDYGQFTIMPMTGNLRWTEEERACWFSHKTEVATPYYYKVYLSDYNTWCEFTATERSAKFRISFPATDSAYILVDALKNKSRICIIDSVTVIGYSTQNNGAVPSNFKNYFTLKFSKPFQSFVLCNNGKFVKSRDEEDEHCGAYLFFPATNAQQVEVDVSSSFVSIEQSFENMKEVYGLPFETVKSNAQKRWNDILGKVEVSGGNIDDIRTFYSCLYRSVLFPRKFYEITSQKDTIHYNPYNGKIMKGPLYVDTGFWDTFRSLFPLLNLLYPDISLEIQKGLVNVLKANDYLPEWSNPGHLDCMIGNNSFSVIADAYLSGIRGYDINKLFEGAVYSASHNHPIYKSVGRLGYQQYNAKGYIPCDIGIQSSVSSTLEYSYDDWCLLQLALALKRPKSEIAVLKKRANNYQNLFDSKEGLMRGRMQDGRFQTPFRKYNWGDPYTEGNAYQYTWSVFHDIQGLSNLLGGRQKSVQLLDSIFNMPPIFDTYFYKKVSHEMREMQIVGTGNYAHGNQPMQHVIYLYDYFGEPWKTQYRVRSAMDRLYRPTPDGYCGDEDNGQTSAWYIFSALGFYPVCPGSCEYVIGSPFFKHAMLHLNNGKETIIDSPNNSKTNVYIDSMMINETICNNNFINMKDIRNGARIKFIMSDRPNMKRGINSENAPYSYSKKQ